MDVSKHLHIRQQMPVVGTESSQPPMSHGWAVGRVRDPRVAGVDVFAGSWRRIVRLLKSKQVEYLMGPMQTQAEWIVQSPWLVIEAEAAL